MQLKDMPYHGDKVLCLQGLFYDYTNFERHYYKIIISILLNMCFVKWNLWSVVKQSWNCIFCSIIAFTIYYILSVVPFEVVHLRFVAVNSVIAWLVKEPVEVLHFELFKCVIVLESLSCQIFPSFPPQVS
jgi:hypothetical protein